MKSENEKISTEKPQREKTSQKPGPVSIDNALKSAISHHQAGRLSVAEQLYRQIIAARGNHIIAIANLGMVYKTQGKMREAVQCFQKVIDIRPDAAKAHYDLGRTLHTMGRYTEAINCFKKAITIEPDFADAYSVLSNTLRLRSDLKGAFHAAKKALTINPELGEAWLNLGNICFASNRLEKAVSCYRRAIKILPKYVDAYMNTGMALNKLGKQEQAVSVFQKALYVNPENTATCAAIVKILKEQGRFQEASQCYEKVLEVNNTWSVALWDSLHLLPIIYDKEDDIARSRTLFDAKLRRLEETLRLETRGDVDRAFEGAKSGTNYFMAYQALDDKDFQVRYGRLIHRVARERFPAFSKVPSGARNKKLRIGYVSFNFYGHTISKLFGGWIKTADRDRFSVHTYYLGRVFDPACKIIKKWSDYYRNLPALNLEKAAAAIRDDRLDILVYPDIGMDPLTLLLASLRLAPIQCASWGHPVTTGLPTIDYFLSSDLMEPPKASSYYSEKLIRLPDLSVYYQRPGNIPDSVDRSRFGFERDHVIFLCSHFLPKFLPQYDVVFPRVALEVPSARFVFVAHKNAFVTKRFRARLDRVFHTFGLESGKHCLFFSRLPFDEYFRLNRASDIYLDSIGWSGGNTTFEAIACKLPVVTMPGPFMRARHAYGMLKKMEVTKTVASSLAEYVDIACRLGQDEEYRRAVKKEIAARSDCLFNDLSSIRGLEEFYESVSG